MPDDGYYFGLGAFETIAVEGGAPRFLEEHLERLAGAMEVLGLGKTPGQADRFTPVTAEQVLAWLARNPMERGAIKVTVSPKNCLIEKRENHYRPEQYEQGFTAEFSDVRRNSTSPFTYIKSLSCGDCILEKRRAAAEGIDEPVFLNERGEICEGAVSNLFFIKGDGTVVTPKLSCGLLPGVVRRKLLEHGIASEAVIGPEEVPQFREAFLTNSLLGIMPLRKLGGKEFISREITERIMAFYICL